MEGGEGILLRWHTQHTHSRKKNAHTQTGVGRDASTSTDPLSGPVDSFLLCWHKGGDGREERGCGFQCAAGPLRNFFFSFSIRMLLLNRRVAIFERK